MYIDVIANKNLPRISRHDLLSYKLLVKIKKIHKLGCFSICLFGATLLKETATVCMKMATTIETLKYALLLCNT